LSICPARGNEEKVGETIEKDDGLGIDRIGFGQRDGQSFGTAAYGAGGVEEGGAWGSSREDEVFQGRQICLHVVNFLFEPRTLRVSHTGGRSTGIEWGGEICSEDEQIGLNSGEEGVESLVAGGLVESGTGLPDERIDFIDRTICLDAWMTLLHAVAAEEAGGPLIAGAGVNFHGMPRFCTKKGAIYDAEGRLVEAR